jgi:hypothetical protein
VKCPVVSKVTRRPRRQVNITYRGSSTDLVKNGISEDSISAGAKGEKPQHANGSAGRTGW